MAFETLGIQLEVKGMQTFNTEMKKVKDSINDVSAVSKDGFSVAQLLTSGLTALGTAAIATSAALGGALLAGLSLAVKEAADAEVVWTNLAAAIQAHNYVNQISIEESQQLAMQFRDLAGGSDEAIASIIEMGVRMGTVTKQKMPMFLQSTLDLAAATGKDFPTAARMMAMAIEDPEQAFAQLKKAGIMFQEDVKQEIKDLRDAGRETEAFDLFMRRLAWSTKGRAAAAAKTFSAQISILKNHIAETFEEIGGKLLPVLTPLIEKFLKLADNVAPKLISLFEVHLLPTIKQVAEAFDQLMSGNFVVPRWIMNIWNELVEIFNKVSGEIEEHLLPLFDEFGKWWSTNGGDIVDAVGELGQAFSELFQEGMRQAIEGFGKAFKIGFQFLIDHKTEIIDAIKGIATWISDNKETIIKVLTVLATLNLVGDFFPGIAGWITKLVLLHPGLAALAVTLAVLYKLVAQTNLGPTANALEKIAQIKLGRSLNDWERFIANINDATNSANKLLKLPSMLIEQFVNTLVPGLGEAMLNIRTMVEDWLSGKGWNWEGIKTALMMGVSAVFNTLINNIKSVWSWPFTQIGKLFTQNIGSGIAGESYSIYSQLSGALRQAWNVAVGWASQFYYLGSTIAQGIASGINDAVWWIRNAIDNLIYQARMRVSQLLGYPRSPSPVFEYYGKTMSQGIAVGISQDAVKAISAMQGMVSGIMSASTVAGPMQSSTVNNSTVVNNNYNYTPSYGSTPNNPSFDFAIMQARAM